MILAVKRRRPRESDAGVGAQPRQAGPGAIHMDGMWGNYLQPWQGIGYNVKAVPGGVPAWAETYTPKYKGRIIVRRCRTPRAWPISLWPRIWRPASRWPRRRRTIDAAFKKSRRSSPTCSPSTRRCPSLQSAGAGRRLRSPALFPSRPEGEGARSDARAQGRHLLGPVGVRAGQGRPQPELAGADRHAADPEMQAKLQPGPTPSPLTRPPAAARDRHDVKMHSVDWDFVAKDRANWVTRWDREMAI